MSGPALKSGALPTIKINIDGHYSSKVYTSGSSIKGHAVVNCPRDLFFDAFEIVFTGAAFTRLDFVQQFPTHTYRSFMKLRMPLTAADLPASQIFEAGKDYSIPFNFVVPHTLTLSSCYHKVASPTVRDQHLRLPPTLGFWEADDQGPDMAQVEYAVKARAYKRAEDSGKLVRLVERSHLLKVLPALGENAPLAVTDKDERYKLSKSKTIRKGLLPAKTGKLTASIAQPSAVMLSPDAHSASTSTARINLSFAPASTDAQPPKISAVSAKLLAVPFFTATPADHLPDLGSRESIAMNHSLNYSTTNSLFTLPVGKVSWTQESVAMRRDSGYSSCQADENMGSDSDAAEGRGRRGSRSHNKKAQAPPFHYTSTLDVPVTVPISNKKIFLPTFHSCLISRTYTLQLSVSFGATTTPLTLTVPLQIGVEKIYEAQSGALPSFESVVAQDEADEANHHLQPRVLQVPLSHLQEGSILPGYSGQAPPSSVQVV